MSQLHLRRPVACAVGLAPGFIDRFLAGHRRGDQTVLTLRAPLEIAGLAAFELERDCAVHIRRADDRATMVASYQLSWQATGQGPFPVFHGTLSVDGDDDYTSCILDLQGGYEPPGGAVGAAFDLAVGHAVAERVCRQLLDDLGIFLETAYRLEEREKADRRAAIGPG
ncbi:MAG TPA: hypothetical protein VMD91_15860 [Candidatus Sulfotelmatobacter sp.]|nr:hypothetical protein [Candidatus Sulfotelmatobacter sp.]